MLSEISIIKVECWFVKREKTVWEFEVDTWEPWLSISVGCASIFGGIIISKSGVSNYTLIPMAWMSCSHTIEFYFDARKKYHPGCHDMVDTFLCCGGFFIARRGCHSWRDDVVDTFPRHGYYTLHLFAIFCTTFLKMAVLILFFGKFRSSSSSFQSFGDIWSNL